MPHSASRAHEGIMIMPRAVWSKCLPIALWPAADRAVWQAAIRLGDPFDGGGIASRWSAATQCKTAKGYGRYLCWLKERGELDETAGPAARITREKLSAYLEDLRNTNRGHTIQTRIQELGDAMRALAPDKDWRFIQVAACRLRASTVPARDKPGTLLRMADVIAQGYRMMDEASESLILSELGRAALYRNGLLLVFLAYHPLRLRNLSSLRIGRHLIVEDDPIVLKIDPAEIKTRQGIEQQLSPRLACAIRRYIDRYRRVLLQARGRWHAPAADDLWVSRDGSPCTSGTFRNIIAKHLIGPNGLPLSPHLFRSMAATTVSIEAPGSVDLIPAILTHRSHRAGEHYYNLASSLDASRAFNSALDALRKDLGKVRSRSTKQEDRRR
jgi:integrase/recombinase XerD